MLDFSSSRPDLVWPGLAVASIPHHGLSLDLVTPLFLSLSVSLPLHITHPCIPGAAVVWVLIRFGILGTCFGFSDKRSCSIPLAHNGKVCGQCLFNHEKNFKNPLPWLSRPTACVTFFLLGSTVLQVILFIILASCLLLRERERERERERCISLEGLGTKLEMRAHENYSLTKCSF